MFILSNFFMACAGMVNLLLSIASWLIMIRALISWVNPDPYNPIVQFLTRTTEPILYPIRKILPPMAIDISPVIAFMFIYFLQSFLVATLRDIGARLQ